jgi:hypothetical protein
MRKALSVTVLDRLLRGAAALALTGALALGMAPRAMAAGDEPDVPRLVSFGGHCPNCPLVGRHLLGAKFVGCDFSGAKL